MFEEIRGLELHERLISNERGRFAPAELITAATETGQRSLGRPDAGRIEVGALADFVERRARLGPDRRQPRRPDRSTPRPPPTSGRWSSAATPWSATASTDSDPSLRCSRGPCRRWENDHERVRSPRPALAVMSGTVSLVGTMHTESDDRDRDHRDRRAGQLRRHRSRPVWAAHDAAVVVDRGRWSTGSVPRGDAPAADRRIDLDGRALVPGFVDSHSHLVFAGDRSAEFAARMTGTPYDGGGIATSMTATRRPPTTSCAGSSRAGRRDAGAGHHHRRDQERLRPERRRRGSGPEDRRGVHRRDDVPRRARRAAGVAARPRRLPRPGHRRDAHRRPSRTPAGSTCSANRRRRTRSPATRRGAC